MGALGRESDLGQRIRRILSRREAMRPLHARLITAGAVLALITGATGLERCPDLVGFASSNPVVTGHAAVLSRAAYHDVVYRPEMARPRAINTVLRQPATSGSIAPQNLNRPASASRATPPHPTPARLISSPRPQRPETRNVPTGWVLMTSVTSTLDGDSTAYSTRVVMTSFERPADPGLLDASASPRQVGPIALRATTSARASTLTAVPASIPQILPYAAVPVRGGWLVIQL